MSQVSVGWRWAAAAACLWCVACGDDEALRPAIDPPFAGALRIDLECVEQRRAPDASETRRLIDAVVETYGGAERWQSLSFRMVQDAYHTHTGDIMSNHAKKEVFCAPDDSYRATLTYKSGDAVRLLDHGTAYMKLRIGELTATVGDNHVLLWWEHDTMRLPHLLSSPKVKLTGRAPIQVDERWLIPVEVDMGRRPVLTLDIDPDGLVVRRVHGSIPLSAAVRSGRVSEDLMHVHSEWKRFDGVLVPGRVDSHSSGIRSSLVELHRFEEASIDDAVFAPE